MYIVFILLIIQNPRILRRLLRLWRKNLDGRGQYTLYILIGARRSWKPVPSGRQHAAKFGIK